MTKFEKVLKGLECCKTDPTFESDCEDKGCPYKTDLMQCINHLCADALTLLKEQEPRVMTVDEVQLDELVWIEVPQSDEIWPALLREVDWFGHLKWEMVGYAIARSFLHDGYGRDWRCWTARPTDEQREAVKWE